MDIQVSLTDHFLIAMPTMLDPNFYHTVTYIIEHNEDSAIGIVINQPVALTFGEMAKQLGLVSDDSKLLNQTIFRGGPVELERGFVLHRPVGKWDSTLKVSDNIAISTSSDVVEALAKGEGPSESLVALGYAGWGAGQLEQEMADNAWLSGPADADVIFKTNIEERWKAATKLLGVEINQISSAVGHA